MFNYEKILETLETIKELKTIAEYQALMGMIADYAAAKFNIDSQDLINDLLVVNQYVNKECGTMVI